MEQKPQSPLSNSTIAETRFHDFKARMKPSAKRVSEAETLEDVAEYVGDIIKKDLPPNYADIESAIEDYMEEHDNDDEHWMSFHKFEVLND